MEKEQTLVQGLWNVKVQNLFREVAVLFSRDRGDGFKAARGLVF